ncbi:hypothetical protein [Streptomyces sp.]|uniref:hypothetical protein n=1 Tax=Streptomyces sp. TaxID=1931 RepID=UPI002F9345BF
MTNSPGPVTHVWTWPGFSSCDSSGIGLFLRVNRRCRATGTRLPLSDVPLLVKSMRVLGVDRELRLVVR